MLRFKAMTEKVPRRIAGLLLVLTLILITIVGVLPQEEMVLGSGWDKLDHVLAFVILGLLAQLACASPATVHQRRVLTLRHGLALAALLGYGVALELVQAIVPGRHASVADVAADAVGLLLAALLYGLGRRGVLLPFRVSGETPLNQKTD